MKEFDTVIIGLGGIGSAATYYLSRERHNILGLDLYSPPHNVGSSHGEVRIFRKAYFEHPDYVPLLNRAEKLYEELFIESGEKFLIQNGISIYSLPGKPIFEGIKTSSEKYNIEIHKSANSGIKSRVPNILTDSFIELFEPSGGYLKIEKLISYYLEKSIAHGATILNNNKVLNWQKEGEKIRVNTQSNSYLCKKLIITTGSWSRNMWNLTPPIQLKLAIQYWIEIPKILNEMSNKIPCFGFDLDDGFYYGFPSQDQNTIKLASHFPSGEFENPESRPQNPSLNEFSPVKKFISTVFGEEIINFKRQSPCTYSMTPDEHFIIDQHPEFKNVYIAGGFSGHGYKFCSVVGEMLSEFVILGKPRLLSEIFKWRWGGK